MSGQHHPADAQAGRQGLARRAHVDHAIGRDSLQRADRCAVVAVLGVVVVLDHQVTASHPVQQRGATSGREHDTGRGLVGGRRQHRIGAAVGQRCDVDAVLVDRHRDRFDPIVSQHLSVQPEAGFFHRQRRRAQRLRQQRDGLCRARTQHDALRVGVHAAGAAQIVGHRDAGREQTLRRDVAERVGPHLGQALPQCPQPGVPRKAVQVGRTRQEVDVVARRAVERIRRRRPRRVHGGHHGARSVPAQQEPLGGELAVGVDHQATRHPEVGGEHTR